MDIRRGSYGESSGITTDSGCTEPYALNYNPQADIEDGSCEFFNFQIKVGVWPNVDAYPSDSCPTGTGDEQCLDEDGFWPLVLRFGFSSEADDGYNQIPEYPDCIGIECSKMYLPCAHPNPNHPYPDVYCMCERGQFTGCGPIVYTEPNRLLHLYDYVVPNYVPPSGFHTGIGTEWSGPEWMWDKWLNYSPADYGVEHTFRIHMDIPDPYPYLMNYEHVAEIRFDWLVQYWDYVSPYIESMRLTDGFDGALGVDVDVIHEIMTAPSQMYRWFPDLHGFVAHLKVTPRDPESR